MNHNAFIGIITHLYTQPQLSNFLQIDLEKTKRKFAFSKAVLSLVYKNIYKPL